MGYILPWQPLLMSHASSCDVPKPGRSEVFQVPFSVPCFKLFLHFLLWFQHFESVTIMFSYLDGFDHICANVTPMEVVNLVNKMFLTFDKLSEKHDVYKVSSLTYEINHCFMMVIWTLRQSLEAVLSCILDIALETSINSRTVCTIYCRMPDWRSL